MPKIISSVIMQQNRVTESAAATWTTEEIAIPTAAREKIGAIIIGLDVTNSEVADVAGGGSASERVSVFVLEEVKTSEPRSSDPDVIGVKHTNVRSDGANNVSVSIKDLGYIGKLVQPLDNQKNILGYPTLRSSITIGIISSNAAATANGDVKIYYVLAEFTNQELIELGFRESFE